MPMRPSNNAFALTTGLENATVVQLDAGHHFSSPVSAQSGVGVLFAKPDPVLSGAFRISADLRDANSDTQPCLSVAVSATSAVAYTVFVAPGFGFARRVPLSSITAILLPFVAPSVQFGIGDGAHADPVMRAGVLLIRNRLHGGLAWDQVLHSSGVLSLILGLDFGSR